jgi:hypothetical protein
MASWLRRLLRPYRACQSNDTSQNYCLLAAVLRYWLWRICNCVHRYCLGLPDVLFIEYVCMYSLHGNQFCTLHFLCVHCCIPFLLSIFFVSTARYRQFAYSIFTNFIYLIPSFHGSINISFPFGLYFLICFGSLWSSILFTWSFHLCQ